MKIRIVKGNGFYKVGDFFEVNTYNDIVFNVKVGLKGWGIINKEDAEVVEDEKKTCETCYFSKFYAVTKNCNKATRNKITNELECLAWKSEIETTQEKEKQKQIKWCGVEGCEDANYHTHRFNKKVITGVGIDTSKTGTTENAKHYQVADIQPIEIMQKYLTPDEFIGAMKMQVIKYILRIGHKDDDREDAGKCCQYAKWLVQAMDGGKIVPGGK